MSGIDIRWSTDLVTFFHPEQWGLPADLSYDRWEDEVSGDPRRFFDRMLDGAAEAGLSGVELAPSPGGWVNAARAYGGVDGFASALKHRDLVVSSSYVLPIWMDRVLRADTRADRESALKAADGEIREHSSFLAALSCHTLVTSTVPRASFVDAAGAVDDPFSLPSDPVLLDRVAELLERAGELAAESGVHVAVHTDAYSLCSRPEDVSRLMALTDPDHVRLCIDAGHIALDGADPLEVLRQNAERAPVLHWKDCAAPLPPASLTGSPMERHDIMVRSFRLLGAGNLDWHEWTRVLERSRWAGWGVAELDMSTDPIAEIRACLDYYANELQSANL
jgi:sugar phosphate isomerase/epimerase